MSRSTIELPGGHTVVRIMDGAPRTYLLPGVHSLIALPSAVSPAAAMAGRCQSWSWFRVPGTCNRAVVCDCSLCRLAGGGGGEPAEPL
jgi:hypothetical protein